MKEQTQNISRDYEKIDRKQFVNFKQLLKLKYLKKGRKLDHEHSLKNNIPLKDQKLNKRLQNEHVQYSLFKLPLEVKSFEQINRKQITRDTHSKNSNEIYFPLINLQQQASFVENFNCFNNKNKKVPRKADFFERVRQISIEKLKQAVSNKNKRRHKQAKNNESELSLPSKLNCRSISPLTNYGVSSQKRFSNIDEPQISQINCRISSSLQKTSSRYEDIPISQFIYDHIGGSSHFLEKNIESKMEKIWRKKSKNIKEMTFQA